MQVASPTDALGYDSLFVGGDLDPAGRAATGVETIEHIARGRLLCSTLSVIQPDGTSVDVDFGDDTRLWVQEATTPGLAAAKAGRVTDVLLRDERLASVPCTVSPAPAGTVLSDKSRASLLITVTFIPANGASFSRIIGISGVTVEFLSQGS